MSDQEKVSSNDISSNPEHDASEMVDPDAGATEEERKEIVRIHL